MDFLRPVLSILPSIVGIIGDLFGANDYDYLKFSLRLPNSNSSDDDNIYFIKEGDDIIICNSTKDTIQVSFPAENGTKAVSYAVKNCYQWPVTGPVVSHAKANVDRFEITRGGNLRPISENALGSAAVISVSGKIDKHNTNPQDLGGDIYVKVSGTDLIVLTKEIYTLESLPLVLISGEGNEPARKYQNIHKGSLVPVPTQIEEGQNEITLPGALASFIYSNCVRVEVSVSCTYNPKSDILLNKENAVGIRPMEEKDWEFLKKGRCLNDW